MPKVCILTGKKNLYGNKVSHANNRRRTRQEPNLQRKRIWLENEEKWVRVRISAKGLKQIARNGTYKLEKILREEGKI